MNTLRNLKQLTSSAVLASISLAGMVGCAQTGGIRPPAGFETPPASYSTTVPSPSSQRGSTSTLPPAASAQPAGAQQAWVQQASATANRTDPRVPQPAPAATASGAAADGLVPSRYIARQFPTGPGAGGYAPPSGVTSVPGALGDPYAPADPYGVLQGPRERWADLELTGYPARTGRIMLGGAVNSDAGVTGQLTVDERNFDITRWPRSFRDLFSGTAFRGAGQTLRLEAAPGNEFQRYMVNFVEPSVFNRPVSLSVSGFLFDRRFNDWDEQRLGGRLALGYRITPDLSVSAGVSGQNVEIRNPRVLGVAELDDVLGDNELYSGEVSLRHDTRNSPLLASRGHYFEFTFEEAFGDFNYARFETEFRQYWTLAERADGSGKQTLSYSTQVGFSGEETPIFENFFAGGYATLRGFDFRGASPVDPATGVELGGRFQWLNSVEYMFPITADDAFRGVAFVDFGTVESDVEIDPDNFRVAPGLGLRVAIPMLGPAPLAFDFAYPLAESDLDDRRIFSFYMSAIR